jgi:hypothetical protein
MNQFQEQLPRLQNHLSRLPLLLTINGEKKGINVINRISVIENYNSYSTKTYNKQEYISIKKARISSYIVMTYPQHQPLTQHRIAIGYRESVIVLGEHVRILHTIKKQNGY